MRLTFGSVCSGVGAPEVAWQPLGWRCAFVSEIDPFPRAVLTHRLGAGTCNGPEMFGDFTQIGADDAEPIDLLVGGTPCQSFSVAGKRLGLDDSRGNLAIEYLALARRLRPKWLVWENVPGVLSSNGGGDFGAFLWLMGKCGYGFAYRVLDAQYFGVPQRRRRVFVVGYLGDWRRAAAVLFEPESMRGDSPPRRQAGQRVAPTIAARTKGGGGLGTDFDCDGGLISFGGNNTRGPIDVATACNAHGRLDFESETLVAHAVFDPNQITSKTNRSQLTPGLCHTLPATPNAPVAYRTSPNCGAWETGDRTDALTTGTDQTSTGVAFNITPSNSNKDFNARSASYAQSLTATGGTPSARGGDVIMQPAVRRLTPRECERLQGFPDDWTLVPYRGKPAADSPRYKGIGNSMAIPVMRWIGERIDAAEAVFS